MIAVEQVRTVIAHKLDVDPDDVTVDADLVDDLGGDSLALAELTAELHERFGVSLPASRLYDVVTVGDLVELLQELDAKLSERT